MQPSNHMPRQRRPFAVDDVRAGDLVLLLRPLDHTLAPERVAQIGRWLTKLGSGYRFDLVQITGRVGE